MLRVPFVAMIDAGIALWRGELSPMPPDFVSMFMRNCECSGRLCLLVMDKMRYSLMLSNDLAVMLSHLCQSVGEHVEVSSCA